MTIMIQVKLGKTLDQTKHKSNAKTNRVTDYQMLCFKNQYLIIKLETF